MASNKIYHIEYIFGNPKYYKNIRQTEKMSRKLVMETWEIMNLHNGNIHRMWLMKNDQTVSISCCESKWREEHPDDWWEDLYVEV